MTWLQDEMAYDGITMRLATGLPGHQRPKWPHHAGSNSLLTGLMFRERILFDSTWHTVQICSNDHVAFLNFLQELGVSRKSVQCLSLLHVLFLQDRAERKPFGWAHVAFHCYVWITFLVCSYPQHIIAQLDRVHGYFALQFSIFMKSRQIFTK